MHFSHGSMHTILHQHQYQLVGVQWFTKLLYTDQKANHQGMVLKHLHHYNEGADLMNHTIIGDESWSHHYEP
jgi:hypothetical protein